MVWAQWPAYRPRPTEERMQRAREKYEKDCEVDIKRGYTGDFLCGLEFVMATYNPQLWIHYFND